jgi:hypothetical protein
LYSSIRIKVEASRSGIPVAAPLDSGEALDAGPDFSTSRAQELIIPYSFWKHEKMRNKLRVRLDLTFEQSRYQRLEAP